MRKPSVGVCLEGLPIVLGGAFVTIVFAVMQWEIMTVLTLVFTVLSLNFFRDPERVVPTREDVAVSPADGRVVKVGRGVDPFTGQETNMVSIFMNVFNVHVNRSPLQGMVKDIRYSPGKFFNATLDKASKDNEQNALRVVDREGKDWTVVQIAGLVARRIVCWAEVGDNLEKGQRFGLIKFGSRLDVYYPDDYTSTIEPGETVLAGQSIIAAKKE